MPYCAVRWCGVNNMTEDFRKYNITFHRFPKIPRIKYEWVQAVRLRKELWFPSYASVICSRHFKDECFVHIPHKNRRRLRETAIPTEHLMISMQDHYVDRVRDKDDREKREIRFRSRVIPITEVCEGEQIIKNVYHYLEGQYITLRTYLPDAYDLSSMGDILRRTSDATGVRKETVSDILRNDKLKKKRERFEMKQMNMENFIKELYLDRNPPQNLIIKKFQNPVIQVAEPAPIHTPITPQPGQSLLKTSATKKTRENETPKTTSAKTIASIAAKVIAAKTPPITMAVKTPPTTMAVKTPSTATATKKPKTTFLPKTTAPKTYPGKTAPKTTTKTDLRKTVSTKTDLPKTVATKTDLRKTVSTKTDIRNTVAIKTVSVNTVIAKTKSAKRQRRAPKRVEYKEIRIAPKPSQTTLLPNYSPISSDDEGNGVNVQLDVQEFNNKRCTSFLQHTSDGRLNELNTQSMQLLLWPYVQREEPNEEFGEGFRFSSDTEVENITVEPDIRELCLQEEPNYGAAAEENKKCTCGVQVQMQEEAKVPKFHQRHEVPNNPVESESTQNVKITKRPTEHTIEKILSNIELEATLDVEMDKKSSNNGIEIIPISTIEAKATLDVEMTEDATKYTIEKVPNSAVESEATLDVEMNKESTNNTIEKIPNNTIELEVAPDVEMTTNTIEKVPNIESETTPDVEITKEYTDCTIEKIPSSTVESETTLDVEMAKDSTNFTFEKIPSSVVESEATLDMEISKGPTVEKNRIPSSPVYSEAILDVDINKEPTDYNTFEKNPSSTFYSEATLDVEISEESTDYLFYDLPNSPVDSEATLDVEMDSKDYTIENFGSPDSPVDTEATLDVELNKEFADNEIEKTNMTSPKTVHSATEETEVISPQHNTQKDIEVTHPDNINADPENISIEPNVTLTNNETVTENNNTTTNTEVETEQNNNAIKPSTTISYIQDGTVDATPTTPEKESETERNTMQCVKLTINNVVWDPPDVTVFRYEPRSEFIEFYRNFI